jgi:hypothetical protein
MAITGDSVQVDGARRIVRHVAATEPGMFNAMAGAVGRSTKPGTAGGRGS